MKIDKCLDFVLENLEDRIKFTEATSSSKEKMVIFDLYDKDIFDMCGELHESRDAVILAVQYWFFLLEDTQCDISRHEDFVTFIVTW